MVEYIVNNKKVLVNLFDEIRDEIDAYFIGYLFADGGFHAPTHKRKARMAVSSTDIDIIKFFAKHYQPLTEVVVRAPNYNKARGIIGKLQYSNLVFSSKFSETFAKFGVLKLKKERTFHNIPKKFFNSFLLGVFDADGSITWGKRKDRNRVWGEFKITHQSHKFLLQIQRILLEMYNVPTFVTIKCPNEDYYVLRVSNRHIVKSLFDILYTDNLDIYNKKKFNNYKLFYNEV